MRNIYSKLAAMLTLACCLTLGALTSCSDVDLPESPSASVAGVSNLTSTENGRNVELSWTLPASTDITAVQVVANGTDVTTLEPTATSYTVKNPKAGTTHTYTVRVVNSRGIVSQGQSVQFEGVPARIGYLIAEADISQIADDDEKAAAEWFLATYPTTGDILTPADIDVITTDAYSMIWIQIDRVGLDLGWSHLPSALITSDMIAALTNFVKEGGNLLLTKHATQLLVPIGRIDSKYAPGLFGSGEGGEGSDIWTINAILGPAMDHTYDRRSHAVFAGLETSNQYDFETFPMEGPGLREDHNCMWDCNAYGLSSTPDVVYNFEQATTSTVLAVWGHVADFCVAGLVEFTPTGSYAGRIIANGLSAYEFHMNNTTNPYQSNIERLTSNCIDYLK